MSSKKIIVNGDDFGYSLGVSEGIIQAYTQGILTSTTVLANSIKDQDLIDNLQSTLSKPALAIGVHLNLTYGPALAADQWDTPTFVRPFKNVDSVKEWQGSSWKEYFSTFKKEAIDKEFRAQIVKVQEAFGAIDHLDSHHGAASYEPALTIYKELAKELGLALRHPSPLSENSVYGGEFLADTTFTQTARSEGIRVVDRVDLQYFYQKEDPIQSFIDSLKQIQDGEVVEYMFHPSVDSSHGEWRMKDLEILTSKEVIKAIQSLDITLTTFKESAQ